MPNNPLMDRLRTFFGIRQEPPKNDFRNPIWGDDDDDDGDELYTRDHLDAHDVHDVHEFARHIHDVFKAFGSMFGDGRTFFHDMDVDRADSVTNTEPTDDNNYETNTNSIRDHYLKPGYHNRIQQPKEDIDLDGKISSHEISGLLKQREDSTNSTNALFDASLVPGRSFCQTVITTKVTKSDGSIETRRIVKNGHEIVEESTTILQADNQTPASQTMESFAASGVIYGSLLSDLGSLFRNFY